MQRRTILFVVLAALCFFVATATAKTAQEWKTRNIYQIITDRFAVGSGATPGCDLTNQPNYCGGDFKGIQNNLDYIKNLGFNAIWISPVPDNYPNQFHGYAAKNMTEINSFFGGEKALKELVEACHKKDIWVMVDVVANHMGNVNTIYSPNVPFDKAEHYHDYCLISDLAFSTKNMAEIQRCRLAGLADLDQSKEFVSNYLINWIKDLVKKFDFDGLRIDTVPEVETGFWKKYTDAAGVFATGEVFDGDYGYLASFIPSIGSVLNYPWYFNIKDLFVNQRDMWTIRDYYQKWANQNVDVSILTPFIDNHDNPRFLSDQVFGSRDRESRVKLLKSYTALTLTTVGISIMYYGTEQLFSGNQDPFDREPLWFSLNQKSTMYTFVKAVLNAKTATGAGLLPQTEAYCDNDLYAFYRGKMFIGVTSKFYEVSRTIVTHGFSTGDVICNIFWPTQDCLIIQHGQFQLTLFNGESKIYVPKAIAQANLTLNAAQE